MVIACLLNVAINIVVAETINNNPIYINLYIYYYQ